MDPHGRDRARISSTLGRMVSENAVPIFNAPDRGAGPVERTGAAPDELRVEADRAWRKWCRIQAQSYVSRTRFDGSEIIAVREVTRPPGSGVVRIGSRRSRPRNACLRLETGGVRRSLQSREAR